MSYLDAIKAARDGRTDEAMVLLHSVLAEQPDDARALAAIGSIEMGADRRRAEAIASIERALKFTPNCPDAWKTYAALLHRTAERRESSANLEAAAQAHRAAGRLGADDPENTIFALASLGAAEVPGIAPRAYIEGLFDDYAPVFDSHLRDGLRYRGPEMLVSALARRRGTAPADTVDLGCGTGLCGPLLRPFAPKMVGVDLSLGMLDLAAQRGCYDTLTHADVADHLRSHQATYDLAVAADVLVYIGDLLPLFQAAHRALREAGWLAVTVERHDGVGFVLHPSRRYAHSLTYVAATAAAAGFEVEAITATTLRMDAGAAVKGSVVLLRRAAGEPISTPGQAPAPAGQLEQAP